jgi:hypothetical protein
MIGNVTFWDAIQPEKVVEGSFKLLGKRKHGAGNLMHEMIG